MMQVPFEMSGGNDEHAGSEIARMSAREAARYLKDFACSIGVLEGMTKRAQVRLSSPLGKSGRDTLLMEAFDMARVEAHSINNGLDGLQPRSLRVEDMQEAFVLFPSLRKIVSDAIETDSATVNADQSKAAAE